MSEPLPARAVIGILGGGQLGRMLAMAAARLGYRVHIYDPSEEPPAADVAWAVTRGAFEDADALAKFGQVVDVATYEFENVPLTALDALEAECPLRPGREALRVSQDRLVEKTYLQDLEIRTAKFAPVENIAELEDAAARLGYPAILKTRRLGYDGKGQVRISEQDVLADALAALKGAPAILEAFVPFEREISVIAARALDGSITAFDPGENVHEGGILKTTTVPAQLSAGQRLDAVTLSGRLLNALDYVGVIGVEFFVTDTGLLVNEFAPRVHNSGHWTEAASLIDQFEQHIRAVSGLPLGDGTRHSDAVMTNLLGDDVNGAALRSESAVQVYGKAEARPGRKMGHLTRLSPKT